VIFSIVTGVLGRNGDFSPSMVVLSMLVVGAMFLMLAFIAFVVYKVYIHEYFHFLPLMFSAAIVFILAFLAVIVRAAISEDAGFQMWPVVLALIASLATAAIFSALIKVAQRLLSAW
jgi:hypothetical protein